MLFRCFGMHPGKANCGSLRRRASTQFADVRLELLEDRFLLSGSSASGLSEPQIRPDLSSPTETDRSAQAAGSVSPAIPQVNASPGATEDPAQSGMLNADDELPTSNQQQPAAASSTDKQQGGSDSGSSRRAGPDRSERDRTRQVPAPRDLPSSNRAQWVPRDSLLRQGLAR